MAKILVVDDNSDLQYLLTALLQLGKFEVQSALSGVEAFTKMISFKPDLILLDVLMDKENGRDICKEIKEKYKDIAVILLSGNPKLLLDHEECGADDVIEKPFNNQDILNKIKKVLRAADKIY